MRALESVYDKVNQQDPFDTEVLVQGFGRMSMKQLQRDIGAMLEELHQMSQTGDPQDFRTIKYYLERSTLPAKLNALIDAYDDVAKNNKFKRKFGD